MPGLVEEFAGPAVRTAKIKTEGSVLSKVTLDAKRRGNATEKLVDDLKVLVAGQEEAITAVTEGYQQYLAGMTDAGRPVGSFLFLGPTGVGKTHVVESIAQALVGDRRAVVKIHCGEFQHSHEIAKLVGSPPGYLGHRETNPMLSQEALNHYHTEKVKVSFVLFDEIEKASDALRKILLGILDKAELTLGDNKKVDFSKAMIFMTSNLGAAEMVKHAEGKTIGLVAGETKGTVKDVALGALRRKFEPEFVNRLDKVVVFNPLTAADLEKILALEIKTLQGRIFSNPDRPFVITLTEAMRAHLLATGTDKRYGARPLKRAVKELLRLPVANLLATAQVRHGDVVEADWVDGAAVFSRIESGTWTLADMQQAVA